jgi:hypothetical protein
VWPGNLPLKKMSPWRLFGIAIVSAGIIWLLSLEDGHPTSFAISLQKHCAVGGEAILKVPRAGAGEKLVGEVRVLACHRFKTAGLVQVVGYDTTNNACVAVDYPAEKESEGLACVDRKAKHGLLCGRTLCSGPVTWSRQGSGPFTRVNGLVRPSITRVKVIHRRNGKEAVAMAYTAHIDKRVSDELQFPSQFAVFTSVLQGCPPRGPVWVEVLETGKHQGVRMRIPNFMPGACSGKERVPRRSMHMQGVVPIRVAPIHVK